MATERPGDGRLSPVWLALVATVVLLLALTVWRGLVDEPDVLLVGDSIMRQAGARMPEALDGHDVVNRGVNGSGLLNPEVYDWVDELPGLLEAHRPDAVVVLFIGNYAPEGEWWEDDDGRPVAPAGDAFFREWEGQAEELLRSLEEADTSVYWVLPPPVSSAAGMEIVLGLREVSRSLADRHPDLTLVDASPALTEDGSFTFEIEGAGGGTVPVRVGDGVHLAPPGAKRLAIRIAKAVEAGER